MISTAVGTPLILPLIITVGPPNVPRYNMPPRFDKAPAN